MNLAQQYIEDVLSGEKQVCKYVKLAVERHIRDLEGIDGYYFDEDAGQRAIDFYEILRHTKGRWARKPFQLSGMQAFTLWSLYGWKKEDTGYRRFTKAYVEVAKKWGKSEFAAGLLLLAISPIDEEEGAEIYTAATSKDQASIVFKRAKTMLKYLREDSDWWYKNVDSHKYQIFRHDTESFIKAVASDADSLEGLMTHLGVIDEFHVHKNWGVYNNLRSGSGSRMQPLFFVITTAGFNIDGACYQMRKGIIDVLTGSVKSDHEFGIIATLDEGDDWKDKSVWPKAAPNLGITPTHQFMEEEFNEAITHGGSREVSFKTKNLNIWTRSSETWIQTEMWDKCNYGEVIKETEPGWMGMDLSTIDDLSAVATVWPPSQYSNKYRFKVNLYCPEQTAHEKQDKVGYPYLDWAKDGFITLTDGNVIDQDKIQYDTEEICKKYNIQTIGFDQFQSSQISGHLADQGMEMERFAQNYPTMTEPIRQFETLVLKGEIDHYNNPVLRWMLGNARIKYNYSGLMMLTKEKPEFKIDGIVAMVMALGVHISDPQDKESVFEGRKGFMGI